ncbi:MAG TPA: SMP-30/gluconolactonase/LRE family protein [Phycisphaerales bacterium]|nr:SMP-30/gluconolactonase/LRE family protein [Phycisphaerales bacterium]
MFHAALVLAACCIAPPPAVAPPAASQPAAPDPMAAIIAPESRVEHIATGLKFSEGPVWVPATADAPGRLLFSDINADTIYAWTPPADGQAVTPARPRPVPGADDSVPEVPALEVFRRPSRHANGLRLDREGRLLICEHDGRVIRLERDGAVKILAEAFQSRSLNSPNDLCVGADGSVYFTDPPYGLRPPMGAPGRTREIDFSGVYRITPEGNLVLIERELRTPNGIALAPDGRTLYVADHGKGSILAYAVGADGTVDPSSRRGFATTAGEDGRPRGADGVRVDAAGNVFAATRAGVMVFAPSGERLGVIPLPDRAGATNICFGGPEGATLYITAAADVYRVALRTRGARPRP